MVYKVLEPGDLYKGKSYSNYIADWCNWFFSLNPDQYNLQPWNEVKFLRSFPSPEKLYKLTQNLGQGARYEGSPMFLNTPNIMVGKDKITMYEDQAVFFPSMLAVYFDDKNEGWEYMQNWVKIQNSKGDDPPSLNQLLIDEEALNIGGKGIIEYKLDTNGLFALDIPEGEKDQTLKYYISNPPESNTYNSYCQGYFFLAHGFNPGRHTIFSIAKGASYEAGEYFGSYLYEIDVVENTFKDKGPTSGKIPSQIFDMMREQIIHNSSDNKTITPEQEQYLGIIEGFQLANQAEKKGATPQKILKNYRTRNKILKEFEISEEKTGIDVGLFKDLSREIICEEAGIPDEQLSRKNKIKISERELKVDFNKIKQTLNNKPSFYPPDSVTLLENIEKRINDL